MSACSHLENTSLRLIGILLTHPSLPKPACAVCSRQGSLKKFGRGHLGSGGAGSWVSNFEMLRVHSSFQHARVTCVRTTINIGNARFV